MLFNALARELTTPNVRAIRTRIFRCAYGAENSARRLAMINNCKGKALSKRIWDPILIDSPCRRTSL